MLSDNSPTGSELDRYNCFFDHSDRNLVNRSTPSDRFLRTPNSCPSVLPTRQSGAYSPTELFAKATQHQPSDLACQTAVQPSDPFESHKPRLVGNSLNCLCSLVNRKCLKRPAIQSSKSQFRSHLRERLLFANLARRMHQINLKPTP